MNRKKNRTFKMLRRKAICRANSYNNGWIELTLADGIAVMSGGEIFAVVDGADKWLLTSDGRASKSGPAGNVILTPDDIDIKFKRIISEYVPLKK